MESSNYISERIGEITNQGLKTQGIEAKTMMAEDLRGQGKRKGVLNSTNST
jgi:hypothetical protein